jgi:hypothetical protein
VDIAFEIAQKYKLVKEYLFVYLLDSEGAMVSKSFNSFPLSHQLK